MRWQTVPTLIQVSPISFCIRYLCHLQYLVAYLGDKMLKLRRTWVYIVLHRGIIGQRFPWRLITVHIKRIHLDGTFVTDGWCGDEWHTSHLANIQLTSILDTKEKKQKLDYWWQTIGLVATLDCLPNRLKKLPIGICFAFRLNLIRWRTTKQFASTWH